MTSKTKIIAASLATLLVVGGAALPALADHGGMGGAGGCPGMTQRDRDLTSDEIRTIYEGKLLQHGADGMKVGEITDAGKTYKFDILNADGTVHQSMEVDKRTGWSTAMMERMKNGGGHHGGHGGPMQQQQNAPAAPNP